MSKDSILKTKSMEFAKRCVHLYQFLTCERREYILSKQVLRSGTSIGANIAEAIYGSSHKDFAARLYIAEKEAAETLYWPELLHSCGCIPDAHYLPLDKECRELLAMLAASIQSCS